MSKNIKLLFSICVLGSCVLGYNNAFAKGVYYDYINPPGDPDPWTVNTSGVYNPPYGDHCFVWGQWPDFATYNDWVKVGSDGYEAQNELILQTNTDPYGPDRVPRSPWPDTPETYFYWWSDHQFLPTFDTWAGYEWTVPETGPGSDQIITGFTINGGWFNYPADDVAPYFVELHDGDGNVLWSWDTLYDGPWGSWTPPWIGYGNFLPNTVSYFPEHRTKTIRIVFKANNVPHWVWATNSAYLGLTVIFTVDDVPWCGDAGHPYPKGDFDKNCVVDLHDFDQFSLDWLECNDPNNESCGS